MYCICFLCRFCHVCPLCVWHHGPRRFRYHHLRRLHHGPFSTAQGHTTGENQLDIQVSRMYIKHLSFSTIQISPQHTHSFPIPYVFTVFSCVSCFFIFLSFLLPSYSYYKCCTAIFILENTTYTYINHWYPENLHQQLMHELPVSHPILSVDLSMQNRWPIPLSFGTLSFSFK